MKKKFVATVTTTREVEVVLDLEKFSDKVKEDFNSCITHYETDEEHAGYIAWLYGTERFSEYEKNAFIEGYGPASDAGISARVLSEDEETDIVFRGEME